MSKWNCKVRLRVSKYYISHLFNPVKGYDVDFYDWNQSGTECTASFFCSDDYSNPLEKHTKEDLEEYIVKKFGANIIRDIRPAQEDKNLEGNNAPIDHPGLDKSKKDTYKDYYDLLITKEQLQETDKALATFLKGHPRLKPFKTISNSYSYKPDDYIVRIGKW